MQTTYFRKKFKKRKKSILGRFKAIKMFGWYSCSFLILDALRTHARPLKLNFRLVGMVAILVKVSFWDKIRAKFRNFVFRIWHIEKVVLLLWSQTMK